MSLEGGPCTAATPLMSIINMPGKFRQLLHDADERAPQASYCMPQNTVLRSHRQHQSLEHRDFYEAASSNKLQPGPSGEDIHLRQELYGWPRVKSIQIISSNRNVQINNLHAKQGNAQTHKHDPKPHHTTAPKHLKPTTDPCTSTPHRRYTAAGCWTTSAAPSGASRPAPTSPAVNRARVRGPSES